MVVVAQLWAGGFWRACLLYPCKKHSSHTQLTAGDRVRFQCSPYRIVGGQSGTGPGFFSELFGFSVNVIVPLLIIHSCVIWGMDKGVSGQSPTET
jgi:hypothetical protein